MKTEFFKKVVEMRSLQKAYFKTRSKDILQESKRAEREVDQMIDQEYNPTLDI